MKRTIEVWKDLLQEIELKQNNHQVVGLVVRKVVTLLSESIRMLNYAYDVGLIQADIFSGHSSLAQYEAVSLQTYIKQRCSNDILLHLQNVTKHFIIIKNHGYFGLRVFLCINS